MYKGCFSRVYIWTPSIYVDNTWKLVKDYIRDHLKPNDRDKYYFDENDPSLLQAVITTQQKIIGYQKENIIIYTKFGFALTILQITRVLHVNLNYYISYIPGVGITWLAP